MWFPVQTPFKRAVRGLLIAASICSLFTLAGCSINPATGGADFVTMSKNSEVELGKKLHEELMRNTPVYENAALQAYVNEVGQKMAAAGDRPELEYHFTIIDSPDINAFALPGGYIYVNRGLLLYLQSEAQLAAVLGHEIAHVTARHAARQQGARAGAGALSVLTVLTTGSAVVADAANQWSGAAIAGYGREMELEADKFGAQYLARAKYDPQAMIEVIGILKDHERYSKLRAQEAGKKASTYHGVFATHPRNDQRLRELVAEAGKIPATEAAKGVEAYREQLEGVVYGNNYELAIPGAKKEENRFSHGKLGFTLVYPKDWEVNNQRAQIVAKPEDDQAEIRLTVARLKAPIPPEQYLREALGIGLLQQSEPLQQYGLSGHTGITQRDKAPLPDRVAVLQQGSLVYIVTGVVNKPAEGVDYDAMFMETIKSFRPYRESKQRQSKTIHYVKANSETTFARLAQHLKLGKYGEDELRLINGYYPRGEPVAGEWIKIVQ